MAMKVSEFSIEVPAKWVLTGEHAVLRGKQAIAFPYSAFSLKLSYQVADQFSITANPFQTQIKQLIGRALEYLELNENAFKTGELHIQSQIPMGAGLGSSAALCVAIARLVLWKTGASTEHWIKLATHLEDVFHGKSSGMDVATIAISEPILFSLERPPARLEGITKFPRFELYDSGKRGETRDCIERVKHWQKANPHLLTRFDEQMGDATDLSLAGLKTFQTEPDAGCEQIARAMSLAQNCFETWGLVTPELMEQKHELLRQGALAVKLTGSGLGGFWVALWRNTSPAALTK